MFCSTIIPTVGRPSLTRAVQTILQQKTAFDFEVIVVNDGGRPLPPADWRHSPRVQIIQTSQRERGAARNAGAAIARGVYLHFLDDDDWLAPGSLTALHAQAQRQPDAALVYGAAQLVNRQDEPLMQLYPDFQGNALVQTLAGEWLPLQASLIRSDAFWAAGGFNPRISGIEDVDLVRRLALIGDVSGTPELVAFVGMGAENSTTDGAKARLLGQAAREVVFEDGRAWPRLWQSADNAYWRGRIARAYLTSAVWNGRRGLYATAVSRLLWGSVSGLRAVFDWPRRDYWRAVLRAHQGIAFVQRQAGD
ncbi:MAG TPA: glycosyltransferase [Anaerolineae bacterium]|nr:glycosyltransferase [Anaerolineae bacterium]